VFFGTTEPKNFKETQRKSGELEKEFDPQGEGVLASAKVELGVTVESLVNLVQNEQKEGWM
jgi:hypothetical protein